MATTAVQKSKSKTQPAPVSAPVRTMTGRKKAKQRNEVLESLGLVPAWDSVGELRDLDFDKLVEKRTRLMDEIRFREEKRRELDEQIMAALAVSGVDKVTWEDRPVQIVNSRGASKIVPEKLLMHGVSADVIADSTEPGKEYSYLLVGKVSTGK